MSGFYLPSVWFDKSQQNPWLMPCIERSWGGFANVFFHCPTSPATFAGTYWPTGHSRRQSHSPSLPLWCWVRWWWQWTASVAPYLGFQASCRENHHPNPWGSSSCDTCTRLYAARPGTVGWAWMVTRMAWQLLGEQQIQHRKRCRISRGPRSRPKMDHLVSAVCGQACFPPPLHPCPTVVADSSPGVFWRREVTLRFPSHYLGTLHHKGREYK